MFWAHTETAWHFQSVTGVHWIDAQTRYRDTNLTRPDTLWPVQNLAWTYRLNMSCLDCWTTRPAGAKCNRRMVEIWYFKFPLGRGKNFLFVLLDGFTPHLALDWSGRWPLQKWGHQNNLQSRLPPPSTVQDSGDNRTYMLCYPKRTSKHLFGVSTASVHRVYFLFNTKDTTSHAAWGSKNITTV